MFIAAAGDGAIAAGQTIELMLTGLPHHSRTPLWTALLLAGGIGIVGLGKPRRQRKQAERRRWQHAGTNAI